MIDRTNVGKTDEELLHACNAGDSESFAALWERHRRAGFTAARNIAPSLEAEDVLSEAYLRVFELVSDGRGPTGAFRPYLYKVIRSVAVSKLRTPETAVSPADFESIPDLHEAAPWEDNAFDLNAVAAAFATLTPRWQAALWYTEVEGMPPREAAPLLGVTANTAAALALRAREALRSGWVEAHVNQELADAACATTLSHLQRYQRGKLTARLTREVEAHLDTCVSCSHAAAEYSTLNKRLGLVIALAIFGGVGGVGFVRELGLVGALSGPGAAVAGGNGGLAATSASTGLGTQAGLIGGVGLAVVGVASATALAISLAFTPNTLAIAEAETEPGKPTVDTSEQHDSPAQAPDSDEVAVSAVDLQAPPAPDSLSLVSEIPVAQFPPVIVPVEPPVNPPVTPPVDPPVDPTPPTDAPDLSISVGYLCLLPGDLMIGDANRYGVIRLRGTAPGGAPIEIFNPMYDPALEGQPGNVFSDGIFTDPRGNTFDFGFFTGTDFTSQNEWLGADPSTLPSWNTHFPGLTTDEVTLELRLVRPDSTYSSWTQIDTNINCI